MKDIYHVLGISQSATEEEIKKAYRRLSKKYHPDTNPGNREAEERFKEVSEAYAILQDPERRKQYDQELKKERTGTGKTESTKRAGYGPKAAHSSTADMDLSNMEEQFARFFGFRPGTGKPEDEMGNQTKKTKTDPLDTTDLFERYMGLKKQTKGGRKGR